MRRVLYPLVVTGLLAAMAGPVAAAKPIAGCPAGPSGFVLVPIQADTPPSVDLNADEMVCRRLMDKMPEQPHGPGPIYNWVDNVMR